MWTIAELHWIQNTCWVELEQSSKYRRLDKTYWIKLGSYRWQDISNVAVMCPLGQPLSRKWRHCRQSEQKILTAPARPSKCHQIVCPKSKKEFVQNRKFHSSIFIYPLQNEVMWPEWTSWALQLRANSSVFGYVKEKKLLTPGRTQYYWSVSCLAGRGQRVVWTWRVTATNRS